MGSARHSRTNTVVPRLCCPGVQSTDRAEGRRAGRGSCFMGTGSSLGDGGGGAPVRMCLRPPNCAKGARMVTVMMCVCTTSGKTEEEEEGAPG